MYFSSILLVSADCFNVDFLRNDREKLDFQLATGEQYLNDDIFKRN